MTSIYVTHLEQVPEIVDFLADVAMVIYFKNH